MTTVNEYFDAVYWINLDRRTDLRAYAEEQHRSAGITAERLAGFDISEMSGVFNFVRSKGHIGCTLTHIAALTLAQYRSLDSVLVLEDDATFGFDFRERFAEAVPHVPDDWEILYLGSWTDFGPFTDNVKPVSGPIVKLDWALCTHAYAVRGHAIDKILVSAVTKREPIDQVYAQMMRDGELTAYAVKPSLAFQTPHFSETDYVQQTLLGT